MKNKILLEEISRIQGLMGKTLINEQWTTIAKIITNLGDEFAELTAKYADDFTKLANAATDEEAIKILAKLSNAERRFADEIIPHVMKALPDDVTKEIASIINGAEQQLKAGVSRKTVDAMVEKRLSAIKTQFDEIRTIIRKDINDSLDGYKPPTPKPPTPEPVVDTTLKEKMKKTFESWDEIAPGSLSVKDKLLLNDLWFRGLRAKINYILNGIMNNFKAGEQKSIEKIVSLLKKASSLEENFADKKIIWKTIDSEIEALRKNEDFAKEQVYKVISDEVDKKLGSGKGYKFVEKLKANDPLGEKAQSYWKYLMDETYIGKMFTGPSKSGGWGNWFKNFANRTFMTLTTGNPRKLQEIYKEFIVTYGPVKGFLSWYLWMWAVHRTFWPAFLGTLDMLYYGWVKETGDEDFGNWWETEKHFVKERFYDMFSKWQMQFDQTLGKEIPKREFDWLKSVSAIDWLWDDISSGLDWHVAGGTRRLFRDLEARGREAAENVGIDTNNVTAPILGYKNEMPSFVDFGIEAGYTPEETEKFSYDQIRKVYITNDGREFKFVKSPNSEYGTFEKNTPLQ
jgi:uncharacterized coiled-coil DUF342 family protein